MKFTILFLLTLLLTSISVFSFAESIEIIDSSTFKDDTTYIINRYVELDNLESYLDEKTGFWDNYGNGIIALFTVLISTIGAYFIAKKQIHENSKAIQLQVRANNISSARIKWVNELRLLMAEFIMLLNELMLITEGLAEFKTDEGKINLDQIKPDHKRNFAKMKMDELFPKFMQIQKTFSAIKLYLNLNEEKHVEFINSCRVYLTRENSFILSKKVDETNYNQEVSKSQLEKSAQEILKDAWEQAKTETGYYQSDQSIKS